MEFQKGKAGCTDFKIGVHDQHGFRPAGLEIKGPLEQDSWEGQRAVRVNQDVAFARDLRIRIGDRLWRHVLILGDEEAIIGIRRISGGNKGGHLIR